MAFNDNKQLKYQNKCEYFNYILIIIKDLSGFSVIFFMKRCFFFFP